MQLMKNFALLFMNSHIMQISLEQGFVTMESILDDQHHVRYPTLPIIFEYPLTPRRLNWGAFYLTN